MLPLVMLLGACPVTVLGGVPDWLRAAAQIPLGKYDEATSAILLLDEQEVTVADNGEFKTVYRRAYKILRPEGRRHGKVVVYLDSETSLNHLRAWSILASGSAFEVGERDTVETGISQDTLYADTRYKVLKIPAADPGNIVGYEYEQRQRPSTLQDTWWFQKEIPVRKARFQLQLPPAWEYEIFWLNHEKTDPHQLGRNQWLWEVDDVPAIEPEPLMPAFRAVAGRMGVTCYPRGGKGQGSWQVIGRWYAQLAAARRQPDEAIRQKVTELTSTATSTTEKIRALTSYVQKEIRYVAIEVGIGGYQPHAAREIFADHYGDCKDKATLLSSMLEVAGVKSFYVLVHTDRGVLTPDFPTAQTFNHVILAIQLPADIQEESLRPAETASRFGQLLFFDPTDPLVALGSLPATLQAGYGLVVGDDGGELVKLPLVLPAFNRLLRSANLIVDPDGTLRGVVTEVRSGAPAVELRAQLVEATEAGRKQVLENFLGQFLARSSLQELQVQNIEKLDEPLVVAYAFTAKGYAKQAGDLLLVRLRVLGHKGEELLNGKENRVRRYPIEFPATTAQGDVVNFTLPEGYKLEDLPPSVEIKTGPVRYTSKAEGTGNVIHYTRLYQIEGIVAPPNQVDELDKFNRRISIEERSSAVLKHLSP